MRFQAFLSHNSADKPAVEALARRLEKDGITCFLDKWHLIPGEPWQPALEAALDQSDTCAVFIGPSGFGPWQNEEMRAAISRRVSDESHAFRVVPVVLPRAEREQRSRLPTFLVAATWVEFLESLDDENAYHRLKCGIQGIAPGQSPDQALYSGECPYRGLQVFDAPQASFFFGRDSQVDWIIDRLNGNFGTHQEHRFLGIVGASGSGKSSLVRAGLIPALRAGGSRSGKEIAGSTEWPIVVLKPGSEPLKALADALFSHERTASVVNDTLGYADLLGSDERRLHATIGTALHNAAETTRFVIVVDQFEELFTLCSEAAEQERQSFIDNLLYASSVVGGKTLVIITMRADFYGKCARYERLAHALSEYQELVPPLGENELRAAIEQPAQLCGLELEPGLTDLLLQDMRQQPAGALPLLQQTLLMLWERRAARRLTVTAYNNIGKIEGALEAHANKLYEDVLQSDEEREVCRRVLLMLTNPGEGTEDTRRRATRNQLGSGVTVDSVLQSLAKGRLITIGETEPVQVEVAHEALIRGWHKLREWLDVDRESVRIVHRLADVAEEWRSGDRDPAFLYRGSRLAQAEEWDSSHAKELADLPLAREFLDACISQRESELQKRETEEQHRLVMLQSLAAAEREKAEEQAARATTFRGMLMVAAAIALVLTGSAVYATLVIVKASSETADALGYVTYDSSSLTAMIAAQSIERQLAEYIRAVQDVSESLVASDELPAVLRDMKEETNHHEGLLNAPASSYALSEKLERYALNHSAGRIRFASMFITDAKGTIISAIPVRRENSLVGQNYAWRGYFHGGLDDLPRDTPIESLTPIADTHLSTPYLSPVTGEWKIGISEPLFLTEEASDAGSPDAVIVVHISLHDLDLLQSRDANQFAVLIDGRGGSGRGTVLQHPLMDQRRERGDAQGSVERYMVSTDQMDKLLTGGEVDNYYDPYGQAEDGGEFAGTWTAAMHPVSFGNVFGEERTEHQGDLLVLVQYRLSKVVDPLLRMRTQLLYGGATIVASLLLSIVLAILAMWYFIRRSPAPTD